MTAYRAAIIGCGMIGSEFADDPRVKGIYTHAGAYSSCSGTELVGVCDTDPRKLERCGRRWNVEAQFRDFREMITSVRPEIVSVCTPDRTHAPIIRDILDTPSVRAILAEKPLALTLSDARSLVRKAEDRGVLLIVNYSRRFDPCHRRIKECLDSGTIGKVHTVNGYYSKGILHNGTHWLDLARFLVGEIVEVRGRKTDISWGEDPTLNAELLFGSGATGYLHGCDAEDYSIFEMDLLAGGGRIQILDSGHMIRVFRVEENQHFSGYRSLLLTATLEGGMKDVLLHAVEDVVQCLNSGGLPQCSGRDGVAALQTGLAIRRSAVTGKPVRTR